MAETCLSNLKPQQGKAFSTGPSPDLQDIPFSIILLNVGASTQKRDTPELLVLKHFNHSNNHISFRFLLNAPEWYSWAVGFSRPSLFGYLRCVFALGIVDIVAGFPVVKGCDISRGHRGVIRLSSGLLGRARGSDGNST